MGRRGWFARRSAASNDALKPCPPTGPMYKAPPPHPPPLFSPRNPTFGRNAKTKKTGAGRLRKRSDDASGRERLEVRASAGSAPGPQLAPGPPCPPRSRRARMRAHRALAPRVPLRSAAPQRWRLRRRSGGQAACARLGLAGRGPWRGPSGLAHVRSEARHEGRGACLPAWSICHAFGLPHLPRMQDFCKSGPRKTKLGTTFKTT